MRRRILIKLASEQPYLNVLPEEVQWINVNIDCVYNVFSNTNWLVDAE